MMKTTIEVLKAARGRIAQGWCQGEARMEIGGRDYYCAVGGTMGFDAITRVAARTELNISLRDRACYMGVERWNDFPGRTQEEVLALFDETIRRLEER